jgi:pimeloyl-ACP methyl ester carboxylesterase
MSAAPLTHDDAGSGTPLVLLHGFPMDRGLWAPQRRALSRRARVIVPDLRGFGASAGAPPVTMDGHADDVAALLDVLGIEQAVVGGMSMGGYVAFAFWRRHRARVRALILSDTRAGADGEEGKAKRREMIASAKSGGAAAVADAMMPGIIGKSTRAKRPEIVREMRAMLDRAPVPGLVAALQAMMDRLDSTPTLATIDVPTLIVVGEEDVLTPPKESEAMHAAVRGSRLEIVPKAGHASNFERPSAYNHLAAEFLDTV